MELRGWRGRDRIQPRRRQGQHPGVDRIGLGHQPQGLAIAPRPERVERHGLMPRRIQRPPERQVKPPGRLEDHPAGARPKGVDQRCNACARVREAAREARTLHCQDMQVERGFTYVDPGVNLRAVGEGLTLYAGHRSPFGGLSRPHWGHGPVSPVQTTSDGDLTLLRTALKRQGSVRPRSPRGRGANHARAPQSRTD